MDELKRELDFLREHLPVDWERYGAGLFERFAAHAVMLRERYPRVAALDREIFCHYVLCPRVNDEDLSFYAGTFYEALRPRIDGLPSEEAVTLEVNRWCHEHATYRLTDERTASPLTVYRSGFGRCGEESAFLTAALRSVGIPARQVYVPRWSHCDDNHAWVEALCDGRWRFLGACEPEPELDRGWFPPAAAQAVLVRSRAFGGASSPLHGEFLYEEDGVRFYNQTARYAPVARRTFRALREGRPAAGARFCLQILNEASFHTVAVLTAGEDGEASAVLGLGSLHVLALHGGWTAEGDGCGGELTLSLAPPPEGDTPWRTLDFHPSAAPPPAPGLSGEDKARRAALLRAGDALRARWVASLIRSDPDHPEWDDILAAARGNGGEVLAFLRRGTGPGRADFLRALPEKDLRDTPAGLLEERYGRPPAPAAPPERSGLLRLTCVGAPPVWGRDWSLSRWTGEGWRLAELSGVPWREEEWKAPLPPGRYRIVTTVRLPAGDQLAALRETELAEGETARHSLYFRPWALEELLYRRELPPVPARTPAGEDVPDVFASSGAPALTLWLEPGREPTAHLLAELAALSGFPGEVTALLRPGETLPAGTPPWVRPLAADWEDAEPVARRLNCDPAQFPLAVLTDGRGRARFAAAGYRVGLGALLERLAEGLE